MAEAEASITLGGVSLAGLGAGVFVLGRERLADGIERLSLTDHGPDLTAHRPQVRIDVYRLPDALAAYEASLLAYRRQEGNFRLTGDGVSDQAVLSPARVEGAVERVTFRMREGRVRRRILQGYLGREWAVLLVFSLDSADFLSMPAFGLITRGLSLEL